MEHHPIWWTQHHHGHQTPTAAVAAAIAVNGEMMEMAEKEHMFEKTLTPSDVGKLNRLVIPKQHAERYFPIGGGSDSTVDFENLLTFEDESGKCWKFRYSYWNSSQSYVLTKGWSRYVKEKALDTGDVVVFMQLRGNNNRRFIDFRRKLALPTDQPPVVPICPRVSYPAHTGAYPVPSTQYQNQPYCLNPGLVVPTQTTPSNGKSKTIRLFGVNVGYQPDPSDDDVAEPSQCDAYYEQYGTRNGHALYAHNYMVSDEFD